MQDRYAGDLGDYGKLGLLRELALDDLRVGLVWYLVPDEDHNDDGKHVTYLSPDHREHNAYRACDPDLYDRLAQVVRTERSVVALQRAGVLAAGTIYYDERLDYGQISGSAARRAHRQAWSGGAVRQTTPCDLICVDPDNGLECRSVSSTAAKGPKYAFFDELSPYVARQQTLVVYHHANRTAPATTQALERTATLRAQIAPDRPVHSVLFRRGSCRIYLIVPGIDHEERIARRLDALLAGPWGAHFTRGPTA